ncbi:hypothetical protein D3C72_1145270 [compost metagenome]
MTRARTAFAAHHALADRHAGQFGGNGRARAGAARIAHGARARLVERRGQQLTALVLVGRRHHHHVGDAAQVGDIVGTRVRGAVGADQAGAVQREHHRQVLQRHVVDQLVIAALQEGGVDRHHRLQALAGQAAGEGHRVLLGDADVVVAVRETPLELDHAGAFAHCRGDADQALVGGGHVAQPVAEHLRVGLARRLGRRADALGRVELARAVVQDRVGLGQLVALALLGHHMQELRAAAFERALADVLQRRHQRVQVMAVDRADVVEAEFLEQRRRHHHALGVFLEALGELQHRRRHRQHLFDALLGGRIELAAQEPRQVAVERAHRRRDRHVVVVEHHHQRQVLVHAGVVQRLEGHARGHGAVADHRHRDAFFTERARAQGHAQCGRDRG